MPIMGSEPHHRGHPLPEPAHFPARTSLSVAELLSRPSAPDSQYHRTTDSALLPPVQRLVSRSTPPTPPALSAPVTAPPAADHPSPWTAVNHASPHVSPTTNKLPPISSACNHSSQWLPQPLVSSFDPVPTSEASRSPQNAARSQSPINSHCQDSAIYQQRVEAPQDTQASSISSDVNHHHHLSHRSPSGSQRSTSPKSHSHPTTPSSPPSVHQLPSHSGLQNQTRPHLNARPNSNQRSPVHVEYDPSNNSNNTNTTNNPTRQQRYNVRFNQIYTSHNMPPSQKPRNDPPAAAPVLPEPTETQLKAPERSVTPSAPPASLPARPPPEEQPQTQQRRDDPSVERCKYCHEIWKRPLPDIDQYQSHGEDVPAQNSHDIARNSMNLIARLRNFGTQADRAHDQWCYKHRFCGPPPDDIRPPSPPTTESKSDSHSTGAQGSRRDSKITENPVNNKRKSDQPHDSDRQINSKSRKVTFKT